MPKINQEEYELLKSLDDKWKWIARDGDRRLEKYSEKPYKYYAGTVWRNEYNRMGETHEYFPTHLFQFIQWTDDKPYEIAELIEEYESEEKEVRDLEWAKKGIESLMTEESQSYPHDKMVEQEVVLGILNQLEQETLSQEWIDEHSYNIEEYWQVADMMDGTQYAVSVENLQNLLVPKQEEVDRAYKDGYEEGKQHGFYKGYREGLANKGGEPETVADVVSTFWKSYERLKEVMSMEVEELEE